MAFRFGRLVASILLAITLLPHPGEALDLPIAGSIFDFFSDLNLLPVSQEQELSKRFAREVESKHRIVRDPRIAGFVSDVGRRLVAGIRRPQFAYRFRVVADRSVNAFNIGGGYI
ncbi:MAG: M48 family peptidase, partial [Candidatus Binatia bacterium]